jgi:hypothetical protein
MRCGPAAEASPGKINVVGSRWLVRGARAVILAGVAACLALGSGAAVAQAADGLGLPVRALVKSCDLGFMPTKPTVTGPSILGNAWAVCDVPPERHVLTLSLQYREGGAWRPPSPPPATRFLCASARCMR